MLNSTPRKIDGFLTVGWLNFLVGMFVVGITTELRTALAKLYFLPLSTTREMSATGIRAGSSRDFLIFFLVIFLVILYPINSYIS